MIQADYSYYDIDLADIWDYQRNLFLNGHITIQEAKAFLDRIQLEIYKHNEPVWVWNPVQSKDDQELFLYYRTKSEQYQKALFDIKEMFGIEFFVRGNKCYQYDRAIIIDAKHPDFHYWFALKLKQYQNNLWQLEPFLNFQQNKSFESRETDFEKVLSNFIRQYQHAEQTSSLVESIRGWIADSILSKNDKKAKPILRDPSIRKMEGEIFSFYLVALRENPKYFETNSNNFMNGFKLLKDHGFIDKSTEWKSFKAIFKNQKIEPKKRIIWVGSNKELQWFIKILMYESKKIANLKNDIWLTTSICFVKKNGENFADIQLRTASGKQLKRKDLLAEIVKHF